MVGWTEFSCWSKLGRAKLALTMIILSFEALTMIILSFEALTMIILSFEGLAMIILWKYFATLFGLNRSLFSL